MRSPFLLVLVILMVPFAIFLMPVMIGIAVVVAVYSIVRETWEGLSYITHHENTA